MSTEKVTPDSELSGQKGINVVEDIVLAMGFLWHPAGPFDAGIDGRIELRDARTKKPLNRYLGVQSKGWAKYTTEDRNGFEFLCEASDIDYWMQSLEPVLLVCSHPKTRQAWFKVVTDWFADAERRASRRVVFDKQADRFDASRAVDLLRRGTRAEPVLHRRPASPPEQLVTNLLPLQAHGDRVWSAPTEFYNHRQVHSRYEEVGGLRASDYLLREERLHSLRDPRSCALRHLCDTTKLDSVPVDEWADGDDPRLRRYWVELLRRALLQQVKHQLQWHPARGLFYFAAPEPLAQMSVVGPYGRRLVVKVKEYFDKRRGEQRAAYVRHQAFRPGFVAVDGRWHLEVEPDYLFTYDGERESFRADEYLAGIKAREKNLAVVGHLRMWEHIITRPPSLLSAEPPLLTFGPLLTAEAPIGIDDALWRGKASGGGDAPEGQEELAA